MYGRFTCYVLVTEYRHSLLIKVVTLNTSGGITTTLPMFKTLGRDLNPRIAALEASTNGCAIKVVFRHALDSFLAFLIKGQSMPCQQMMHPPREWKFPGLNPARAGMFPGSSHTSDLKIGTPVAILPGAWCYRVSAGTGWPGVSILWLGEVESWMCNFCLSVAARKIVWADPSLRYTRMLQGR